MKKLSNAQQNLRKEIEKCYQTRTSSWNVQYERLTNNICRAHKASYPTRSFDALVAIGFLVRVSEYDYRSPQLAAQNTPAGRAELAASAEDAGEGVTAANLRQALHEAATGQTEPVATLWDGVYDARSDVPRAEYDDLAAKLARAEAALDAIIGLPDSADFLTAWSIAVATRRGDKPAPKTTFHRVTVAPSIGDKVRIKKDREQEADALIAKQSKGIVGRIVSFDTDEVGVEFEDERDSIWRLTFDELEIVELGRDALAEQGQGK